MLVPLLDSVIVLCFVVRYFVSILVLQSSRWGRESWLLCFFVFLVSRDCCVVLARDATSFLQFVIVVFPDYTHLLISDPPHTKIWICA